MYYTMPPQEGMPQNSMIFRDDDGAWIPDDPGNRDYIEYLDWVAEGNTAEVYDHANPPAIKNSPGQPSSS